MNLSLFNNLLHRATGRRLMKVQSSRASEWEIFLTLASLRDQQEPFASQRDARSLRRFVSENAFRSKAQLFQDLWVLWELRGMRAGYFVEFGAFDGLTLSNTWLMEMDFGWKGILAEPNPDCHDSIRKGRSAILDSRCVYDRSGQSLEFSITPASEFSTIKQYAGGDVHSDIRSNSKTVSVLTISLDDLLQEHRAPDTIDYMSLDTEGSELQILKGFDWKRHIRCITVEHNFTAAQAALDDLLKRRGYVARFPDASRWDGWYIHSDDLKQFAFE